MSQNDTVLLGCLAFPSPSTVDVSALIFFRFKPSTTCSSVLLLFDCFSGTLRHPSSLGYSLFFVYLWGKQYKVGVAVWGNSLSHWTCFVHLYTVFVCYGVFGTTGMSLALSSLDMLGGSLDLFVVLSASVFKHGLGVTSMSMEVSKLLLFRDFSFAFWYMLS